MRETFLGRVRERLGKLRKPTRKQNLVKIDMLIYNESMSKYTGKPTIRFIVYKNEFYLKDDQGKIRIESNLFFQTLKNRGWPPYYHENATKLKRFYDTYVITKELATNLKRTHRKESTRIIVLAKREKEI